MIKNIIFDLNQVVVTYKGHHDKELIDKEFFEIAGMTQDEFWKTAKKYFDEYNKGNTTMEELIASACRELGINPSKASQLKTIHDKSFIFVPGIQKILHSLYQNYFMVLYAGDGLDSFNLKVNNFSLQRYFHKIYATCFENTNKEDPQVYKKILYENNLDPMETVFTDDLPQNIEAAKKAGINTIVFKDSEQLLKDLDKIGVRVLK